MKASDRGEPPSSADVDVELDVVDRNNKPPLWENSAYGPIHIKENVTVGTVVTAVKARLVSQSLSVTERQARRTRRLASRSKHVLVVSLHLLDNSVIFPFVLFSLSPILLQIARNVQVGGQG